MIIIGQKFGRRVGIMEIDPSVFQEFTKPGFKFRCMYGHLPTDAKYVGFTVNSDRQTINLFFEHESFREAPSGSSVFKLEPVTFEKTPLEQKPPVSELG